MSSANALSKGDLVAVMRSFIRSDLLIIEDHSQREERNYQELLVIAEGLESVTADAFYQMAAAKLEQVEYGSDENEHAE